MLPLPSICPPRRSSRTLHLVPSAFHLLQISVQATPRNKTIFRHLLSTLLVDCSAPKTGQQSTVPHTSNFKPQISNLTPQNRKSQYQKSSWETIRCRSEEILKNPWMPDLYPKPQISNFKPQISKRNLKPRIQILNLKSHT